jgi:hypothetical protein
MMILPLHQRRRSLALVCLSWMWLLCAACDDRDVTDTPQVDVETAEQTAFCDYLYALNTLFNGEDSLYSTPAVGVALEAATPSVYTRGVADEAEARAFFNQCCLRSEGGTTAADGSVVYDMGAYGSLTYRPEGDGEAVALMDIALPEISTITRLRFIPEALWPNNDESPFQVGDIVRDKKHGWYWICVQKLSGGRPALFITFDANVGQNIGGAMKQVQYAQEDAMRACYQLANSDIYPFRATDNALQSLVPNLYAGLGYLNGRTFVPNLYWAVGSSFMQKNNSSAHAYSKFASSLMTFVPDSGTIHISVGQFTTALSWNSLHPNMPIGEAFDLYCSKEDLITSADRLPGCSEYYHSGQTRFGLLTGTLSPGYVVTRSYSASYPWASTISENFYRDDVLDSKVYQQSVDYAYAELLKQLFATSDTDYTTPTIGDAFDEPSSTEFMLFVQDEADAYATFCRLCADSLRRRQEGTSAVYDLEDYGSLKYVAQRVEEQYTDEYVDRSYDEVASIEVNLNEVYSLTKIHLIEHPSIVPGDLVRITDESPIWLCVQAMDETHPAIFITFINQRSITQVSPTEEDLQTWVTTGVLPQTYTCATKEAFEAWYHTVTHDTHGLFTGQYPEFQDWAQGIYDAACFANGTYDLAKLHSLTSASEKIYMFYYVGEFRSQYTANVGRFADYMYDEVYTIVSPQNEFYNYICMEETEMDATTKARLGALYPNAYGGVDSWDYVLHEGLATNVLWESPYAGQSCRFLLNKNSRSFTFDNFHEMCKKCHLAWSVTDEE